MKTVRGLQECWKRSVVSSLVLSGAITLTECFAIGCAGALWAIATSGNYAWGQVASDNTLGSEITSPIPGDFLIEGGITTGTNLFHSFSEFSVPTAGRAYFNNRLNIQNIISRVTGSSVSNIDGLIRANGTANLFLLNPNGIIFGPNASLNIGGSFIGSTASSLNFADGTQLSTTATQTTPLLTISVPLGLQFGGNAGSIQVQNSSLKVPDGKTLAIIGGDVSIDGGSLEAPGGRIELGGLAEAGTVGLTLDDNNLRLSSPEVVVLADLSLSNEAWVDASGEGGGNIQVHGKRITLTDGSGITAYTLGSENGGGIFLGASQLIVRDGSLVAASTADTGQGGTLTVNASDSVEVSGTTPDSQFPSGLYTQTLGSGAAGNLTIATRQLIVRDGAQISASTAGTGQGGTLTVNASDSVKASGTAPNGRFSSGLYSQAQGPGAAGNLTIVAKQLIVQDGAQISASTFGNGGGGNLTVIAPDSVTAIGKTLSGDFPSGLFSDTRGTKPAGNLTIVTGQLTLRDGAQVSASTFDKGQGGTLTVTASGSVEISGKTPDGLYRSGLYTEAQTTGDAGDLTVEARQLIVRDGALVSARTLGEGKGGRLTVNASESVELIGTSADGQYISSLSASTRGSGDAGDLRIGTARLIVGEGAAINVSSVGTGKAGNLDISSGSASLENQGFIVATTLSGDGGNIRLRVKDLLLMRHGSEISTTAGTAQAGGDGGNIAIDGDFIVAVPKENSDITANAYTGRGGNIKITTQGIYGLQFQPRLTPLSDITASSEFGVNGTVQINTPDVDPSRGLANLPNEPVNVEVTEGCQAGGEQASVEFFNTGRDGLAPNPYESLSSSNIWEDVPLPTQGAVNPTGAVRASASPATPPDKIVEAQGWRINEKGEVVLVAQMPATRSQGRCRLR